MGGLMGHHTRHVWNWGKKIRTIRGGRRRLDGEDEAVLRMIMQAALWFDPGKRATVSRWYYSGNDPGELGEHGCVRGAGPLVRNRDTDKRLLYSGFISVSNAQQSPICHVGQQRDLATEGALGECSKRLNSSGVIPGGPEVQDPGKGPPGILTCRAAE